MGEVCTICCEATCREDARHWRLGYDEQKARADAAEAREARLAVANKALADDVIDKCHALAAARRECEGLRTYALALRQQVEDTILVAKTDEDKDGFIAAYHFKTGAIHRLLARAREPVAALAAPAAGDSK